MSKSGYDDVADVLPQKNREGRYFWQSFAERLQDRFGDLPGTDVSEFFVDECLRAGAHAVPVMESNTMWMRNAPDSSNERARRVYELRIRLGLFYAASLRVLVQGVSRMRVKCGGAEWHGVMEEGQSYSEFVDAQEEKVEVTWTNTAPDFGKACLVTQVFTKAEELLVLTPELAEEVLVNAGPDGPAGLFGMMLAAEGQAERAGVDVAGVFVEALGECVERKLLPVNTRANGQVFVTEGFWLLTAPRGLDWVREFLRTRRGKRRYDLQRHEVFDALRKNGCLEGLDGGEAGNAVRVYEVDVIGWDKPLELYGLGITAKILPAPAGGVPLFDGTVKFKREIDNGNGAGEQQ